MVVPGVSALGVSVAAPGTRSARSLLAIFFEGAAQLLDQHWSVLRHDRPDDLQVDVEVPVCQPVPRTGDLAARDLWVVNSRLRGDVLGGLPHNLKEPSGREGADIITTKIFECTIAPTGDHTANRNPVGGTAGGSKGLTGIPARGPPTLYALGATSFASSG